MHVLASAWTTWDTLPSPSPHPYLPTTTTTGGARCVPHAFWGNRYWWVVYKQKTTTTKEYHVAFLIKSSQISSSRIVSVSLATYENTHLIRLFATRENEAGTRCDPHLQPPSATCARPAPLPFTLPVCDVTSNASVTWPGTGRAATSPQIIMYLNDVIVINC